MLSPLRRRCFAMTSCRPQSIHTLLGRSFKQLLTIINSRPFQPCLWSAWVADFAQSLQQRLDLCEKHPVFQVNNNGATKATYLINQAELITVLEGIGLENKGKTSSKSETQYATKIGNGRAAQTFHRAFQPTRVGVRSVNEWDLVTRASRKTKHSSSSLRWNIGTGKPFISFYTGLAKILDLYINWVLCVVAKLTKNLELQVKASLFDPWDSITIMDILSFLKLVYDTNSIHERPLIWILLLFRKMQGAA